MVPLSCRGASVLIVDTDAGIRRLIGTVLEHAGFRTVVADDLDGAATLLETSQFAAILRDLNLAPSQSRRSLQQLAATAPELLRRTIVMTCAPARAAAAVDAGTVFAILGKPFDIDILVQTVTACALRPRETPRRVARRIRSAAIATEPATDDGPFMKMRSLQRFVNNVPNLHLLLSVPADCEGEAALRCAMRRTLGALSTTLTEAAQGEASSTRAAVLRAASTAAAKLATVRTPAPPLLADRRDH